jgi:hypothetical protein
MLTSAGEGRNMSEALGDTQWYQAMQDEYDALIQSKTWNLVPSSSNKIWIDCK